MMAGGLCNAAQGIERIGHDAGGVLGPAMHAGYGDRVGRKTRVQDQRLSLVLG
jgi:hypothetical protein